jgi:uncharacterized secreted protein with C-terminal beta-propeller domain
MQGKKKVLIGVLLVIAVILISFWYIFNKPHRSVEGEVSIPVTASEIFSAYNSNESKANALYLDKTISVSGEIAEIKKNQDNKMVLVLKSGDPIFGVACTLKEPTDTLKTGNQVTVKGICSGFASDVVLRDCIIAGSEHK